MAVTAYAYIYVFYMYCINIYRVGMCWSIECVYATVAVVTATKCTCTACGEIEEKRVCLRCDNEYIADLQQNHA